MFIVTGKLGSGFNSECVISVDVMKEIGKEVLVTLSNGDERRYYGKIAENILKYFHEYSVCLWEEESE